MRSKQLVKQQHRDARCRNFAGGWIVFIPPSRKLGIGDTAAKAWEAAARALATKRGKSVRARVDQMIDWHEENKKLGVAIKVNATANTVRKFARRKRGVYRYRDHIIVPLRPSRADTIASMSAIQESSS